MKLYRAQQVYQLDRACIEQDRQSGAQLMLKAARAVWKNVQQRWSGKQRILVLAGAGNNGGDAFAVAWLALSDGYQVEVLSSGDLQRQSPESQHYRELWEQAGGMTRDVPEELPDCDLVIDGLLGIGLNKPLDKDWIRLIEMINRLDAIRVSIDIPSGLHADTGIALPVAVQADLTVSFIGRKLGCYLADGPDICGQRVFDDLGLSRSTASTVAPYVEILDEHVIQLPPARKRNCHKYDFGHVLVVGGDRGMSGAARMAGMAALRCGAGVVSLCVHPDNYIAAVTAHPEMMVSAWDRLDSQLARATVVVLGPGLGRGARSTQVLDRMTTLDKPLVIDADALQTEFLGRLQTNHAILTPHPGEAARLLNCSSNEIQSDRLSALRRLTERWGMTWVLKGASTLTGDSIERVALCCNGHPGMASAGMGDVLAGMIGGFLAQGLSPVHAGQTAVFTHAFAADAYAVNRYPDSLIATDVIEMIGPALHHIAGIQRSEQA